MRNQIAIEEEEHDVLEGLAGLVRSGMRPVDAKPLHSKSDEYDALEALDDTEISLDVDCWATRLA